MTRAAPNLEADEAVLHRREVDGQIVYTVERLGTELGFVVVDSSIEGRARGGLRLVPDVTELELRAAARAMTLKYGLLGLPQGGAKAGLHGDPDASVERRREQILVFARTIEPLLRARTYVPDADLGTRAADIRWVMQALGLPVRRHDWRASRSGEYTAVSCVAAARAAVARRGKTLAQCRVAIEGFGSVGAAVADLLRREGARIVAVSTSRAALYAPAGLDVDELLRLSANAGSRLVESYPRAERLRREQLFELEIDLLCPCARHHSIHVGNAAAIAAPVICPGANNPASPEAERVLDGRGVLYVPDFVGNCGGVLGGTLEFAGVARARTVAIIDRYVNETVTGLIAVAERRGASLRAVAEPLAMSRHAEVRAANESPAAGGRVVNGALELYRRGWIPRRAVAAIAPARMLRSAVRIAPSRSDVDWDAEWERAWKAAPANVWFHHQGDAWVRWFEERLGAVPPIEATRVLKTDAFEDACGFHHLKRLFAAPSSVLMDVSPRILKRAVGALDDGPPRAMACATDVRRLGIRSATIDMILCPSTLDHFADTSEIGASLVELYRVLRPGGRLLITLDNPANPILRVRHAVHGLTGPVGGIIPFHMGCTLSRAALAATLEHAGFEVLDSGYVVHAPRIVGLWLGEWVARSASPTWSSRLYRWLAGVDRLLSAAPIGRFSAHFVAADCRKPLREQKGRPR
jgi:glutamate dehydrogenase/leucine dehydrogenase/SAM-dependent methyltransferase